MFINNAKFSCFLGRKSEFWPPLLDCLLILLKRLESRFWQYSTLIPETKLTSSVVLVVLHPAYINEVENLPGYCGEDGETDDKCLGRSGKKLIDGNGQAQR